MAIYAMGDLHFSGEPPTKPMEVFGAQWLGHREKVITYWKETVKEEDTVLLVGDLSWSLDLRDAGKGSGASGGPARGAGDSQGKP